MKKYVKPTVFCEKFILSRNVASCNDELGTANAHLVTDCVFDLGGVILATEKPRCEFDYREINDGAGYCYQTGSDDFAIFAS